MENIIIKVSMPISFGLKPTFPWPLGKFLAYISPISLGF